MPSHLKRKIFWVQGFIYNKMAEAFMILCTMNQQHKVIYNLEFHQVLIAHIHAEVQYILSKSSSKVFCPNCKFVIFK